MHEMLIEKLKVATESSLSAEERAARMDEIMSEEELRQKDIETELKRLRDLMFRKTQELHKTRTDERNTEAEIQVRILEFRKKRIVFWKTQGTIKMKNRVISCGVH